MLRPTLAEMIQKTYELSKSACTVVATCAELPNIPSEELENALVYKNRAFANCQEALQCAAEANNLIIDYGRDAQKYQLLVEYEITQQQTKLKSVSGERDNQLDQNHTPPLILISKDATVEQRQQRKDMVNKRYQELMTETVDSIEDLHTFKENGLYVDDQVATWAMLCESVDRTMGHICAVLGTTKLQVDENPIIVEELFKIQWQRVSNDCKEALKVLQHKNQTREAKERSTHPDLQATLSQPYATIENLAKEKEMLIAAMKPPANLLEVLKASSSHIRVCFSSLETILALPHIKDLAAFWEKDKREKTMMYDVALDLRGKYADAISGQYSLIAHILSLSTFWAIRARHVADGQLPIDIFLSQTIQSLSETCDISKDAGTIIRDAKFDFDRPLYLMGANVENFQRTLDELELVLKDTQDAQSAQVNNLVAKAAIAALGTVAVLAIAYGILPEQTVALSDKLKDGGPQLLQDVMQVLGMFHVEDFKKLISALRGIRSIMVEAIRQFKSFQKPLSEVGQVTEMSQNLFYKMRDHLSHQLVHSVQMEDLHFSVDDVKGVENTWKKVDGTCLAWMNEVHAAGLSPVKRTLPSPNLAIFKRN